jgi:class 3 adenylate cyclase
VERVIVRRIRSSRQRSAFPGAQGSGIKLLNEEIARRFNPAMLDLGDVNMPCQEKEAVAAVFDLTGFTNFCNQVDAYLAIPRFLNKFLDWFFTSIKEGMTEENDGTRSTFWMELPVLVKFLGDGLLVVWDAHHLTEEQICRRTMPGCSYPNTFPSRERGEDEQVWVARDEFERLPERTRQHYCSMETVAAFA